MDETDEQNRPKPARRRRLVKFPAAQRPAGAGVMPHSFPRRIVVATIGLAPQVPTETIWCLARQSPPFIPTEIHVVTTLAGRQRIERMVLDPASGVLAELARDLDEPDLMTALSPDRLHVIGAGGGEGLDDIDDGADNAIAADAILRLIAGFAADPTAAVHVSIAGGRKTMGFLAGYALTLHGRPQDRLSHVLVGEPFQSHPHFFFPPSVPRQLPAKDGRTISTADARLTLADIPFVRLRAAVSADLLDPGLGYAESVATMQARLRPPSLLLDLTTGEIVAHGRTIRLRPTTFVFALALAHATIEGRGFSWRDLSSAWFAEIRSSADHLRASRGADRGPGRFAAVDDHEPLFRQQVSRLKAALKRTLGPAATPYLPVVTGRRPTTRTVLPLSAAAIEIIGDDRRTV